MKKILLSLLILTSLNANSFIDIKPSEITKENLKTIKEFDSLAYDLSEQNSFVIDTQEIYNYILLNKIHKEDYNRLTVSINGAIGERTSRNGTEGTANSDLFPSNFSYYKTELNLNYNIYDPKTEKDIINKEIDYKSKVLSMVQKYVLLKNENKRLKIELELTRLKQLRLKLMVKTGQKYLDDRIKTIEDIFAINTKLSENKQDTIYMKLELINLVKNNAANGLKELL